MAVNSTVTQPGGRGALGVLRNAWMRLQAARPGGPGAAARATLRLRRAMGGEADGVRVTCVGGYLELRGSVPNQEAANRAGEIARSGIGARGVLNFLEVK